MIRKIGVILALAAGLFGLCLSQPTAAADSKQIAANKKAVLAFHRALTDTKDFEVAKQYLGPGYKQHNPTLPDGPEGIKGLIERFRKDSPDGHSEIKRVIADGDYVILHLNFIPSPNARGVAIADFYKMKDGKIAEHWDVIQPVPEKSANGNGMF
jgi:predicted SnoaL-like aldol condensation-catalyzing enzyme